MSNEIIDIQKNIYRDQFIKYGDTPDGTYNQNDTIQSLRFERLIKNINFSLGITTIHDLGCGICDLYGFIQKKSFDVEYSGTDIIQEMKDLALKKYPNIDFKVRDILNEDVPEKYDFVILSGMFNLPGEVERMRWKEFTRKIIKKMYQIANFGISFNFLSNHAEFYNEKMFYESPEELTSFGVNNLSRHIILDHSYPLYEFTITVYKPDYLKKEHPDSLLQKYLK